LFQVRTRTPSSHTFDGTQGLVDQRLIRVPVSGLQLRPSQHSLVSSLGGNIQFALPLLSHSQNPPFYCPLASFVLHSFLSFLSLSRLQFCRPGSMVFFTCRWFGCVDGTRRCRLIDSDLQRGTKVPCCIPVLLPYPPTCHQSHTD